MSEAQAESTPSKSQRAPDQSAQAAAASERHAAITARAVPQSTVADNRARAADRLARPAAPSFVLRSRGADPVGEATAAPARAAVLSERDADLGRHSLADLHHSFDPLLQPTSFVPSAAGVRAEVPEEECPPTVPARRIEELASVALADEIEALAWLESDARSAAPAPVSGAASAPVAGDPPSSVDAPWSSDASFAAEDSVVDEAAPDSQPPSTRSSFDISGDEVEFFRFDSFPPVVEDRLSEVELLESDEAPSPPSPALLARRWRLRKAVAAIVALVGAIAVAAVIVGAMGSESRAEPGRQETAQAVAAMPVVAAQSHATRGAERGQASPAMAQRQGAERAEEPSSTTEALRAATVELLKARQLEQAASSAHQLIEAEPESAFGYRCLGAALQDQGRWGEAQQVYSDCVKRAERGDVGECAALGGRK